MAKLPSTHDLSSSFRVLTVGTGTCVPRLDRGGPCVLVQGGGLTFVIDLGLGSLRGLLRAGVHHTDLDALFLTHLHPDHTAEVAAFLFASNYDERVRMRALTIVGGVGLRRFLDRLGRTHENWLEPKNYGLAEKELTPGEGFALGPVACRCGAVRHAESSLAYRFEIDGRALVVSGDTGPSSALEDLARGADLLLAEASLPEGASYPCHLTAREAGALGRRAGVRRLMLYHLYPSADAGDPEREASEAMGEPVVVARDGMQVTV